MSTTQDALLAAALTSWTQTVARAGKFFSALSDEDLQAEVAPGRNRLIYLWGHLTAFNDALLPLLRIGDRLHPELDATFLKAADKTVAEIPSAADLNRIWDEINATLSPALAQLSAEQWLERHASVSEEDFAKEPHRNRFAILLGRTGHIAYHLGQALLAKKTA